MSAAPQLLREWDWLQEQDIPSLLNRGPHHPKVPVNGKVCGTNAVAGHTVAFAHAAHTVAPEMQAFVSGLGSQAPTVSFARGELTSVPDTERSRWFREEDRRWVPDRPIAEQVMIGEPSGVVEPARPIRHPDEPGAEGWPPSGLAEHVHGPEAWTSVVRRAA